MVERTRVRRMARDEADAVSALARTVWQATYPGLISQAQIDAMLDARYAPARIAERLDDAHHAWWVAEVDGVLAGFAHAILEDGACKLDKLYVHPDFQRRGVAPRSPVQSSTGRARRASAGCGCRSTAATCRRSMRTRNTAFASSNRVRSTSAAAS